MEFEWDDAKAAANLEKHGIAFEEAARIFNGPVLTRIDDREEYGERREISLGRLAQEVILVVVHTDRNGVTRIISARLASRAERKLYHEHCEKIAR